jgi:arabinose-5-phosphate isomerase
MIHSITSSTFMLKELYNNQRQYLDYFFDRIDIKKTEEFIDHCLKCRGLIFFTGIGKSGLIAEKIAMTFVSTGTKALYLPPANLLHGDLGIVSSSDLFVILSKSGESSELLDLIPFVKKKGATIVSIHSNPHSRLAQQSDLEIELPLEKELCPFDLAPTTSTAIQLIFGDILAVALMRQKQISLEEYALNHPAGAIGKKATLRVSDLMLLPPELPLCKKEDRLIDLLVELSDKKCGCLLVVSPEKKLEGIFTDGDLRRSLLSHGPSLLDLPIERVMNRSVFSINPDTLAWDAMKRMQKDPKKWVMVLPVIEKEEVIGLIRLHDIIYRGFGG